ncbi:LOG family protein [Candidatus Peregrinibacteria bacterium]|nr:MAG: LOG family protein [Candidatus Peregrinibacteria bacterium]
MDPLPFELQEELLQNEFRVTIFGSARVKPEDPVYKDVFNLAKGVGEMGADVITGGGPGLMEAASMGHKAGDKENKFKSIGINIVLPFEQKPNPGLEYVENHELFSTRLDEFMLLSNVVIVTPGGIGTCLELFYTWQLLQVRHICQMPIVLVGKMWRKLVEWVIDNPLKDHYLDSKDLHFVVIVDNYKQALTVVKEAKKHFDQGTHQSCQNWQQYGKKIPKLEAFLSQSEKE